MRQEVKRLENDALGWRWRTDGVPEHPGCKGHPGDRNYRLHTAIAPLTEFLCGAPVTPQRSPASREWPVQA